jgi:hypothetical protein
VYDATLNKYVLTSTTWLARRRASRPSRRTSATRTAGWRTTPGLLARVDTPNDGLSVLMDYDKLGNLLHKQSVQTAHGASVASQSMVIDGVTHTVTQEISAATAHRQPVVRV